MDLRVVTLAERPDLEAPMLTMEAAWPEYIRPEPVLINWAFRRHARHQLVVLDGDDVVARAASVPFVWDGDPASLPDTGWDEVLRQSMLDTYAGLELTTLCALEVAVVPGKRARNLSGRTLAALAENGRRWGYRDVVVPVRPSHKHTEPHLPMTDYIARTRPDGLPSDPWLRVHVREGGQILKVCPVSMTIAGSLAQWRGWTGLPFDSSGSVAVPGALTPIEVSVEHDRAVYIEPNVWIRHQLTERCSSMTSTVPANPAEKLRNRAALIEMIGGYMTAHALGLAAELKLADLIHDGVCTTAELARATGSHEPSLHRLLRMLAAVGITTEPEPGRFGLTEVGAQLREDSPDSLYAFTRMFSHESHFRAWLGLGHTVKTGEAGWDHVFGKNIYAYLADNPELSALFNKAMSQEARLSAGQIAAAYDFSDVKTVVDVGGGDGTLLAAILNANPHLNGVVFDSPSGVAEASGVLAEEGVADRCAAVAGDFFEAVPADGDLYIIKSVFQDWDDEPAKALLRTARAHMPATATLLIVGSVLPETAAPGDPIMFFTDVNMLVNSGGRERTESHFRALLQETGFAVQSVAIKAAGPLSMIEAVPA